MTPFFDYIGGRAIFVIDGSIILNDKRVAILELGLDAMKTIHDKTNQLVRPGTILFYKKPHVVTNVPNRNSDFLSFMGSLTSSERVFIDNSTSIKTEILDKKYDQNVVFGFSPSHMIQNGYNLNYAQKRGITNAGQYRKSLIFAKLKMCENSFRVLLGEPTLYQDERQRNITDLITIKKQNNKNSNMILEMEIHALIYENLINEVMNLCTCNRMEALVLLESVMMEFQNKDVSLQDSLIVT